MPYSISIPNEYGYVVLTTAVGQFVVSTIMGGRVMKAREKFNVPYPNLYAVPGVHDKADQFNRIQRGHQAYFETLGAFTALNLFAGLEHPILASVCAILYHAGSYMFQVGYADTSLDVKMARYQRGGGVKWIGFLGAMALSIKTAGSMIGWW